MSEASRKESLSVRDNRTGHEIEVAIQNGTVPAMDFRQLKDGSDDFGLMVYDPAFTNTAAGKSTISFIDGGKGILRYRGYPIEEVAEKFDFLTVAYLLLHGELPTSAQEAEFKEVVLQEMCNVPEHLSAVLEGMPRDGHPMAKMMALISALGTYNPESRAVRDPDVRKRHTLRLIGQLPVLAAWVYRHGKGLPLQAPNPFMGYEENFAAMVFGSGRNHPVNPVVVNALRVAFILHAEHEFNAGTTTMRVAASAETDPYSSVAAATATLAGPLHGGANEAVLRMLSEIGSVEHAGAFMEAVKRREKKLMGFGHRVYKAMDPRCAYLRQMADEVFQGLGKENPKLGLALEIQKIALEDEYFVSRNLYPNVDWLSGLIYSVLGFPVEYFTVLFLVPRVTGWLAHYDEVLGDPEQKIARPRQVYLGEGERHV